MSFKIRPCRRLSVCCPVTYSVGRFQGHGTVWNLSLTGCRFSGNLPLRVGEVCSLTVILPAYQPIYVTAGIVRWVRGEEYGVETLVIDDESQEDLDEYLSRREYESDESIPSTTHTQTRNHVHRRSNHLQHVGDCRDCGGARTVRWDQ